jgi:hypothetical protein
VRDDKFIVERFGLVSQSVVITAALACAMAYIWHRILCRFRPSGRYTPNPSWHELTKGTANPRRDDVAAFIELADGSAMSGHVKALEFAPDTSLRTIVLGRRGKVELRSRPIGSAKTTALERWHYAVIPAEQIKSSLVTLLSKQSVENDSPRVLSRALRAIGLWFLRQADRRV